ncbi:MAG: hypothetical protein ACKVZ6_07535 [Kineosporiaceae bacterium]
MDVHEIAEELYGLAPEDFIPARDDHAKRAKGSGDRELAKAVTGLRKPSAAAWVVNLLVRRAGDRVEALLDLGESLRTAQAALAGDQLKELSRQRAQVVAAMAREGRRLAREAGHPVSSAIEEDVAETLRAALADPAAADAVRTGRLTTSLSYAGLGEVDLSGVVALGPRRAARAALRAVGDPGAAAVAGSDSSGGSVGSEVSGDADGPDGDAAVVGADDGDAPGAAVRDAEAAREKAERRREEERRRREAERLEAERREARTALEDAEDSLADARLAERTAADTLADARADQERAQAKVAELEEALRSAQEASGAATAAVRPRKREHDSARHTLDVAQRAVDRARAHVERLGG